MPDALKVTGLTVKAAGADGDRTLLKDIDLRLAPGEVLGVVGRSGAGKSVLVQALIDVLPDRVRIVDGEVSFFGERPFSELEEEQRRLLRGDRIGVVGQNARAQLNPLLTVGRQITNVLRAHRDVSRQEARDQTVEALRRMGIPAPLERYGAYPHELSGGMVQRVLIAMALICAPIVLVADEPTSGLDVTLADQVMRALRERVASEGVSSVLISRDMGIVAAFCDRVAVLDGGVIVESAPIPEFFKQASHPVSKRLIAAASFSGTSPDHDDAQPVAEAGSHGTAH